MVGRRGLKRGLTRSVQGRERLGASVGQLSLEYILILAFTIGVLIPGIYFFYLYSQSTASGLSTTHYATIGKTFSSAAMQVAAQGSGSWKVLSVNLPDNVQNVTVAGDGGELVFTYLTKAGLNKAVFFTDVKLSAGLPNTSRANGGIFKDGAHAGRASFRLTASNGFVSLQEIIEGVTGSSAECFDVDDDGFETCGGDCDDANAAIHPGATEVCDGVDNNCDDRVDEGVKTTYYLDADRDGYGNPNYPAEYCAGTQPTGYVDNGDDCDDANATIRPGATELCNGKDDDCNGVIDDGLSSPLQSYYRDLDGDGYGTLLFSIKACEQPIGYVTNSGDCDDRDPAQVSIEVTQLGKKILCSSIPLDRCGFVPNSTCPQCVHPGAAELCDGVDNDCNETTADGSVDGQDSTIYYMDFDEDGYGNASDFVTSCAPGTWYSAIVAGDCNDQNPFINPGRSDLCDSIDNDCNENTPDGSGEAWYLNSCDSEEDDDVCYDDLFNCSYAQQFCQDVKTEQVEVCDNQDNDCDGEVDDGLPTFTFYYDADGDTYYATGAAMKNACGPFAPYTGTLPGDCNDANAAIHPGAAELCDGVDNDCNSGTLDGSGETWYGALCDGLDSDSCKEGTYYCAHGAQACSDETLGTDEIRGNLDDEDCDGHAQCTTSNTCEGVLTCCTALPRECKTTCSS